jgi:hypothetical protein
MEETDHLMRFCILLKLLDFILGILGGEVTLSGVCLKKDPCISHVKDRCDRDLKQDKCLIDRRGAKSNIDRAH